jgi:membrane associated rhomboid family serine protease
MTPPDGEEPSAPIAPAATRCYRHPNREALVRCTRCDRPICPECMREAAVGFHCPDDVSLARRTVRAPRTSVGARIMNAPPFVTAALVAANVVVYLITGSQAHDYQQPGNAASSLFRKWQLLPVQVHDQHDYYQLITSAFLHVSLLHIGSNMLALIVIGPALERLLGWWRFATVYLLGALGGSALVYAFGSVYTAEVGASGAIFGLFAAALVLVRRLGLDAQWLIGVIVLNFVFTFSVHNISKLGHVGGFLAGGLAALAIHGPPRRSTRVPTGAQLSGLGGVLALVVGVVLVRTATF